LRAALPNARFATLPEGGHSPHTERATADQTTAIAREFLTGLGQGAGGTPRRPATADGSPPR
jgi:hypothetical protein